MAADECHVPMHEVDLKLQSLPLSSSVISAKLHRRRSRRRHLL